MSKIYGVLVLFIVLIIGIKPVLGQDIEGGGINGWNTGGLSKAKKLYKDLAYHEAIPVYEHQLKKGGDDGGKNSLSMCELADCYRLTSQFEKAAYWYGKGLGIASGETRPEDKLHYAEMLQTLEKYEESAEWYSKYKSEVPDDKRAGNQLLATGDYGQYLLSRDRFTVHNLPFNTGGYDFSPSLYKDGLVYSSSRDSSKSISREHTWTGTQFFDLYKIAGEGTKFGTKPTKIKDDASTKYHEGSVSFTSDEGKVYYTRNNYYNGKVHTSGDKIVKLKIYESNVEGNKWTGDKNFEYNNDEYSVGHPALTPDNNTMYFISDMPGGFGGTDVYVTKKEGDKWGVPKNLGDKINTEGNEMFPYVDKEGELYFASEGHGGLGGLDIFRTKVDEKTGFVGKIRNIGSPINSSYDDFGLIHGKDKSIGYFTSNRPEGHGLDDIWSFEDDGIYLEGIVVDAKTGLPICSSDVKMSVKEKQEGSKTTECDGEFEFDVVRNTDYCFEGSAKGYISRKDVCTTTKGVKPGGKVYVKIPLDKEMAYAMSVQVFGKTIKGVKTVEGSKSPTSPESVESPEEMKPLGKSKIILSSLCEGWSRKLETDENGRICEIVRCDCDYIIVANANGYLPGTVTVQKDDGDCKIERNCGVNPKVVEVVLNKIPGGDSNMKWDPNKNVWVDEHGVPVDPQPGVIELKDIYYDFDKWFIRKESEMELNKVLSFMQENPDAMVEIGSHTDARAPYDYNIRLSQRRAQSVVDWLIARGISKERMQAVGYGETKTRNGCKDGVECSEYEHQRNRRTEFRVVGGNINIKSLEKFDMHVDPCKDCPF